MYLIKIHKFDVYFMYGLCARLPVCQLMVTYDHMCLMCLFEICEIVWLASKVFNTLQFAVRNSVDMKKINTLCLSAEFSFFFSFSLDLSSSVLQCLIVLSSFIFFFSFIQTTYCSTAVININIIVIFCFFSF